METLTLVSLIGFGLYMNSNNENQNKIDNNKKKGGKSIYNSNEVNKIKKKINKKCKDRYIESLIPEESNIIPKNYNLNKKFKNNNENVYSELLEKKVDFKHNNMVPFFGGNLKQNMNVDSYSTKLDIYTGNEYEYKPKRNSETQLFAQTKNLSNIYGSSIYNDKDRYEPAVNNIKNNEKPIESIQVGPGLGLNYNDKPQGGYQQFDARKYELPKNVNELRTKNNQKISYQGRIIPGKFHIQNRDYSDIEFTKEKQSQFFTDKELLPSKSYVTKAKAKPTIVLKHTNRKESKETIGTVGNKAISKQELRPQFKKSVKVTFLGDTTRNVNTTQNHKNIDNIAKSFSAGGEKKHNNTIKSDNCNISMRNVIKSTKKNIMPFFDESKTTIKQTTECNNNNGNLTGNQKTINYYSDKAKNTIKQTTECNNNDGNLTGNKKTINYYSDKAKNTIKQTTECNNNDGNLTGNKKIINYYSDKAKNTIKQTTECNNNDGNLTGNKKIINYYSDNAKNTIKQTTECNNNLGVLKGDLSYTKKYDDTAKTTIKQTTLTPTIISNIKPTQIERTREYDEKPSTTLKDTLITESQKINLTGKKQPKKYLNDNAKITHKETYVNNDYYGDANNSTSDGYKVANFEAKDTNKQTTSNNDYTGIANKEDSNGYISSNFDAKTTNKETTSNNEYIGTIGGDNKPMSYDDIYNATFNEIKEVISEGRIPSNEGPKNSVNSDDITLQINKNQYTDDRTPNFTNINSVLPTKDMINLTQENDNSLINEIMEQQKNRNDGTILKQLDDNKYNISII
jgi:hypothetical protein